MKTVKYRYYNSGNSLGVIGIPLTNIKHQDGNYTFLTAREPRYQWIKTADLHNSYEKALKAKPASFL